MKIAIIDLGTTMFKLSIKDTEDPAHNILQEYVNVQLITESRGSSQISTEAYNRAVNAMQKFREILDIHHVKNIYAVGTSALRNAENSAEVVAGIKNATAIDVDIISGEQEAHLIYRGVKEAVNLSKNEIVLIMDIGGGSVEFIICNQTQVFWTQSFEVGVQRILDRFTDNVYLAPAKLVAMEVYLTQYLQPLFEQVNIYRPTRLIGSAGAFRTLGAVLQEQKKIFIPAQALCYDIPFDSMVELYKTIRYTTREERLQIQGKGLDNLSRDMIAVNLSLIHFVLQKADLYRITASAYALKEGLFFCALDKVQGMIENNKA
jgi:exopolyphosphatase/guanosine-5'-triphosphate,3'-diphosphate pyrophosphatase